MKSRHRSVIGTLVIALLGLTLFLVVGELAARWNEGTLVSQRGPYLRADSVLGWANVPNLDYRIDIAEYQSVVRTDAHGLIGPPRTEARTAGTYRVSALGDSFVAGMSVNENERFVTLIEAGLAARLGRAEVLNHGVVGYQTDQEVLAYEDRVRTFKPDLVLLFVYPNDVVGSVANDGDLTIGARKPRFRLVNGQLVLEPLVAGDSSESVWGYLNRRPTGAAEIVKDALYRTSSLYRLAADTWFRLRSGGGAPAPPPAIYRTQESALVTEAWQVETALLRRLRAGVEADGAWLGLVIIPEIFQVEPGAWDGFIRGYGLNANEWESDLPQKRFADICRREGLPCLDLLAPLRRAAPVYFPIDKHLRPAGHRVVAEAVLEWLAAERLMPNR